MDLIPCLGEPNMWIRVSIMASHSIQPHNKGRHWMEITLAEAHGSMNYKLVDIGIYGRNKAYFHI